jgi:hypothetical protein
LADRPIRRKRLIEMQKQFIAMTKGGAKAYYAAAKAMRLEMAEWYRDHPEVTLGQVVDKFHTSLPTVRKALAENNVEVERGRHLHREQYRSHCPKCRKTIVHYCDTTPVSKGSEKAEVYRGKGSPTMKTPGGKYIERDADYEVYVERPSLYARSETPDEENGLFKLLRQGRKELGLE